MKTKTLLLLCFIAAFSVNPVKAQNDKVIEYVYPLKVYLECTGDWLFGQVTYMGTETKHGFFIDKVRSATLTGYTDQNLNTESGRIYELSQTATSSGDYTKGENLARISMDGKMVAIYRFAWHTTTNANGTVTADFVKEWWDCK